MISHPAKYELPTFLFFDQPYDYMSNASEINLHCIRCWSVNLKCDLQLLSN